MKSKSTIRHIDLHLPTGWQQATTSELEAIAAALLTEQSHTSRYRPFSWDGVKLRAVLLINGLEIVEETEAGESQQASYTLRFTGGKDREPFTIVAGQMLDLTQRIGWIDHKDGVPPILFPYPKLISRRVFDTEATLRWLRHPASVPLAEAVPWRTEYFRPGELLDAFPWKRYRMASEYMDSYQRTEAAIIRLREQAVRPDPALLQRSRRDRTGFITSVFGCDPWQAAAVTDVRWQVLLFWWAGIVKYLQQQYPRVFARQKPGKATKTPDPLTTYTRITATMEKHLQGMDETKVNSETCHNILQHLDDIAREAAEMEKISRKNKSRH